VDVEYTKHPRIITNKGHRVNCRYVVVASHFPFYDGQGFYAARMYPERAYVIAVKTNQKFQGGMYINAESPTRSIRSTPMNGEELWILSCENHKKVQSKYTINHYEVLQLLGDRHYGIT